ncbi:MAG: TonB-dependent receptor plug domain-containing protein, partial [Flavisolibacter sp.]
MLSKKLTAIRVCLALCFSIFSLTLIAQQRTVTGTVKNADDNSPLVAATVSVRGTNISTLTDANGNFSIRVPNGKTVLTVSSVGYESIDLNVGSQNQVSFSLKSTSSTMNEVVVTGYTAQRKKDITGAISVVDVNNMKKVPVGTGEEALQGQAAGVNIISSAQPGAGSDIRIRGLTGFGNNQPLIVIDGVQNADLHSINVNDIESVQVLKDASAAIYGIAGSTGVILVTTRKGKAGRARVSYDGYYGVVTQGKGYDMANTQQEANAIWQQMANSGLVVGDPNFGHKQFGKGASPVIPDYITPTGYVLCNCPADSVVNPALYDINSYQITRTNKAGTNWY